MHYVCLIVEDDGKEKVRTVEQLMSENEGSERDMSAAQMGFTIMQQMIEAHYGTITLESTEGKGTKVTVNLPADRDVFENNPNIQFIDPEELTRSEKEWLNDYHKACYEKVGPYLTDEEREWLKEYTRAI